MHAKNPRQTSQEEHQNTEYDKAPVSKAISFAPKPFVPGQDASHAYAKPGVYTVKLTLKNLLGDANDRSATLALEPGASAPTIDEFTVTPVQSANYAPATYRVAVKYSNANVCVWCAGDDQPLVLQVTPRVVLPRRSGADPDSAVEIEIVPLDTGCELTLTHDGLLPEYEKGAVQGWSTILAALAAISESA